MRYAVLSRRDQFTGQREATVAVGRFQVAPLLFGGGVVLVLLIAGPGAAPYRYGG